MRMTARTIALSVVAMALACVTTAQVALADTGGPGVTSPHDVHSSGQ
jgi:hypothetical protein